MSAADWTRRVATIAATAVAAIACVSAVVRAHAQAPATEPVESVKRLTREARFLEAETEARRLLADVEASSGADSVQAAVVLDALVEALYRGGKVRAPETMALAERALAIHEAHLPAARTGVARSLTTLGTVLRLQGDYAGARSRFDRALAIQQQVLPARDPEIANTLDGIALVLERQGDNPGAERLHRQAIDIREQALGGAHPDVATSLNNLGNVESNMGRYAEARTLHERALRIREQALGADHPDVAAALNNLAVDARDLGDHDAAWWLLERVLGIYEKTIGPTHPTIGLVHHNLATILLDLGDVDGARLLAERARRLRVPARGAPASSASRTSLTASLTPLVGGMPLPVPNEAARALFERALAIKEAAWGPDHPSVGVTVANLANVHTQLKQWDRAEALYQRALAIRERALGPNHPDVADTLDRIGELYIDKGDDRAARTVFERVLAILEGVYGPDHPHVGTVRQHLSMVLARLGDASGAMRMALDTERIGRDHLWSIGATLPERDALTYAAARPAGLDVALTLAASATATAPATARVEPEPRLSSPLAAVWDAVVRSRAVVLDEMARRHRRVREHEDAGVARLIDDLSSTRDRLARLVVSGPGSSPDTYRAALDRAREARDAAERALAERSVTFQHEQSARRVGLDDVRKALPRESALVAFVRYEQQPTRPPAAGAAGEKRREESNEKPSAAYLAFVMRVAPSAGAGKRGAAGDVGFVGDVGDAAGTLADDPAEPVIVPLGAAAPLDDAIARWRKQITAVAFAGGRSTARAETALRGPGARLRARIWDPLVPHLAGVRRIFIVPDGPLHLVNWDALPALGAGYLIEHAPVFHYVSAERDLVRDTEPVQTHSLLIVDSPVFDDVRADTITRRQTVARPTHPAPAAVGTRGSSTCLDVRTMRFEPLQASAREAEAIASIWRTGRTAPRADGSLDASSADVSRLSGRAATEAELKRRARDARVLHLATHGFFFGSLCQPASDASARGAAAKGASASSAAAIDNPLLLAGFALTGANRRQTADVGDEDGMLTAEEIASLDLSGVEWAVLSACDTGVGEVRAGEGVFGLRRAFHVAGARTVIMSLWPVDDEDTRRWMTGVYERRFRRGAETLEAVRASSLEQLRRRRKNGLSTHPFYWAAFIAAGDWR